MKKLFITLTASMAMLMSFGGFVQTPNLGAQETTAEAATYVWIVPTGKKYHVANPGAKYGKGADNHHWKKVTLKWAKQHGYTKSLSYP